MNHLARGMLIAVAVCASPAFAQQEMGRLFFTPEKRDLLDRQRELNTLANQPVAEDPHILVNGQVRRSSGKRTVWVNGTPQQEADTSTGIAIRAANNGPDRIIIESGNDPQTEVKVGEMLNRSTGEAKDVLGDGKIVVRRRPDSRR